MPEGALDDVAPRWYVQRRAAFCGRNRVTLLRGGDALFPDLLAAFETAHREIRVETYIFNDDPAALRIADALIAAARRGVRVRVLVDGFGSGRSLATITQRFADTGVEFAVFRRVRGVFDIFRRGAWRRLHRKLIDVDGRAAWVGGINIIDDRLDVNAGWFDVPRLDFAVRIEGPIVKAIGQAMEVMWLRAHWRDDLGADPVVGVRALFESRRGMAWRDDPGTWDDMAPVRAAFVIRDNLGHRRAIERAYVEALQRARAHVAIVNPYFYPGRAFKRALKSAAARGVQVTLVMQGKPDYLAAAWAAQALYDELLESGVRIVEYTASFLHAKVAVVDTEWATVGSSNIDPLSLLVNREANIIVIDREFNRALTAEIDAAVANSRAVERDRPVRGRFGMWMVRRVVGLGARGLFTLIGIRRKW